MGKLTLTMIVRNEAERYLQRTLLSHREYIDQAVIIDDASTDDSVEICYQILQGIPLKLVRNHHSLFHNEVQLRKQQWEETIATSPEWILNMDADECFEKHSSSALKEATAQKEHDAIYFRLYDMWSDTHYRDDIYWKAHQYYRPFLVRYKPSISYAWKETPQHCGRFPLTISEFSYMCHSLRVQHFGWASEADRQAKYERYMRLDEEGRYGWLEQYESILDAAPHTVLWED